MGSVDLVPIQARSHFVQTLQYLHSPLGWDVRILASPNHEQFASDFASARHRVIAHALAKATLVNIGRVETYGAMHL